MSLCLLRPRMCWAISCAALACAGCHKAEVADNGAADAEQAFSAICAKCHGSDGKGGLAAAGANAPRNFCDAEFQKSRTDDDLKQVIRKGKGGMPAFGNSFTDAELAGLVLKLRSFAPK